MLTAFIYLHITVFVVIWAIGLHAVLVLGERPAKDELIGTFFVSLTPLLNLLVLTAALWCLYEEHVGGEEF